MSKFDKEIRQLIKKEGLDNPDIFFANYDTFEEMPLFSWWSSISFLVGLSFNERNKFLINHSINLVRHNNLIANNYIERDGLGDYFICLTLTGWENIEETRGLKTNIYVSRRKQWLLSNLNLRQTNTIEENLTREYLFSLGITDFNVFISAGFAKNKRVYVIANQIWSPASENIAQ